MLEHRDLAGNFRAANEGRRGSRRLLQNPRKRLNFRQETHAGAGFHPSGNGMDGRVRAVGTGEGIVDKEVAVAREASGKLRIVRLLLRVEAQIFKQSTFARSQRRGPSERRFTNAIGNELHGAFENSGERLRNRPQRQSGFRTTRAAFRPPQMTHNGDCCARIQQPADSRRKPLDPHRVSDFPLPERHVEIGAHQHPSPREPHIVQGRNQFSASSQPGTRSRASISA